MSRNTTCLKNRTPRERHALRFTDATWFVSTSVRLSSPVYGNRWWSVFIGLNEWKFSREKLNAREIFTRSSTTGRCNDNAHDDWRFLTRFRVFSWTTWSIVEFLWNFLFYADVLHWNLLKIFKANEPLKKLARKRISFTPFFSPLLLN